MIVNVVVFGRSTLRPYIGMNSDNFLIVSEYERDQEKCYRVVE